MGALIDPYLEVEIGCFDPRKAILASIIEISSFVAKEALNVGKETVGSLFHVSLPYLADEALRGVGMSVWQVVMLLVTAQLAYAPRRRTDDTVLVYR